MNHRININRAGPSGLYCVGVVAPAGERPDEEAVDREVRARGLRYLADRWSEQEMEDREGFTLFTKPAEPMTTTSAVYLGEDNRTLMVRDLNGTFRAIGEVVSVDGATVLGRLYGHVDRVTAKVTVA